MSLFWKNVAPSHRKKESSYVQVNTQIVPQTLTQTALLVQQTNNGKDSVENRQIFTLHVLSSQYVIPPSKRLVKGGYFDYGDNIDGLFAHNFKPITEYKTTHVRIY